MVYVGEDLKGRGNRRLEGGTGEQQEKTERNVAFFPSHANSSFSYTHGMKAGEEFLGRNIGAKRKRKGRKGR